MKKLVALLLSLVLVLGLASFAVAETYEVAMMCDIGTIDDKSFNQYTWEGVQAYCTENNLTCQYYLPADNSTESRLEYIELAINSGAKILVLTGFLYEDTAFVAQDMYPDVTFILIDGNPHSADYSEFRTEKNMVGVTFAEQQSGFLVGYSAVKDGYTKLGFMGGMAVPAVIRFGYGFAQGAETAAKEMGISEITMNYHYTGGFDATPEIQTLSASWYADGVECIFGCGGSVGNSVMAAAEATEAGVVIGVDGDQSGESERVISSAFKGLDAAVKSLLGQYYAGNFPGGQSLVYDAANQGVAMPMANARFKTFSEADYEALYAKLVSGEFKPLADTDAAAVTDLPLEIVKVTVID